MASEVTRREFTAASVNALFVGMAVTLTGCGGGGGYSTGPSSTPAAGGSPTPTAAGDKTGSISGNHGHVAVIRAAQLQAGGAVTLDIQGTADHTHRVELSGEQVAAVAAGTRVSKASSSANMSDGYGSSEQHDHTVTFN
jgi:hypothetical protein